MAHPPWSIVISQDQYDEIMKTTPKPTSLDWDGSPIVWDNCDIDPDGKVVSTPRSCENCRFRNLNQFWGVCNN